MSPDRTIVLIERANKSARHFRSRSLVDGHSATARSDRRIARTFNLII
ncbi:hypothetical protein [Burkholderia sp. Bp9031]|nr:hypothetical protein [Burkholderia sp. Bp9031]